GMHTHMSLFRGEENAFHDPNDPEGLSEVGRGFIAGLLHHAPAITAVTNQTVNSYKRLVPGFEAPIYASWARNNRSAIVRVPTPKQANPLATRLEYRSPDPACNPYLAYSAILAAGLDGIEKKMTLPPEAAALTADATDEEWTTDGVEMLPQSLSDALKVMSKSTLMSDTLGEHIFGWFIRNKRREWTAYKTQISKFELDRYFRSL
ncbi:MAG: glutamine synthetase, partial [Acidimicrobiia bacterium]